nr:dihydroxyacetone kinase subunit DhaK [Spiribacter curvatus]
MQRLINDPNDLVDEAVRGFARAHSDLVTLHPENQRVVISRRGPASGRVGVVTGGGSGHEPAFMGYVGHNMVDAVAVGELFSSPTAKSFYDAIKAADSGSGVCVLYGNYAGDNMNVKMAARMAAKDGIEVTTVVANDDVCSAPAAERRKRRGVAGEILMWKVGGAKAATGASLEAVRATAQKAVDSTRSVGVGLAPCTLPANGKPNFEIAPGTMEVGIGHHGEPGMEVVDLKPVNDVADDMLDIVLAEQDLAAEDALCILVSGLGATPINELYVLYDRVASRIQSMDVEIVQPLVGNYFTSLDMMGVTLTVMRLDHELRELMASEAISPGLWVSA